MFKKGNRVYGNITELDVGTKDDEYIFIAYLKGDERPYLCVSRFDEQNYLDGRSYKVVQFDYIEEIPKTKYRAYTEPKLEWIMKKTFVKFKEPYDTTKEYEVMSLTKTGFHLWGYGHMPLTKAFRVLTWMDDTPFGEEV